MRRSLAAAAGPGVALGPMPSPGRGDAGNPGDLRLWAAMVAGPAGWEAGRRGAADRTQSGSGFQAAVSAVAAAGGRDGLPHLGHVAAYDCGVLLPGFGG